MDVALIWFSCMDPQCDVIARGYPRTFLSNVVGSYKTYPDGSISFLSEELGEIKLYDVYNTERTNSWVYTIKDKRKCGPCRKRDANHILLFPTDKPLNNGGVIE